MQKRIRNRSETMTDKNKPNNNEPIIQRTLVLFKPDSVQRAIVGRVLQRFEDAGFKIVGMKMRWINKDFGRKHYFDVAQRHGEKILENLLRNITEGPVIAMVLEGVSAVEQVRKMVGSTEPKSAFPGTIRGDFAQHSYALADSKGIGIKNVVHASGSLSDANYEINLWFTPEELHTYKTVHEIHTF